MSKSTSTVHSTKVGTTGSPTPQVSRWTRYFAEYAETSGKAEPPRPTEAAVIGKTTGGKG
jgi:hypothetical protein